MTLHSYRRSVELAVSRDELFAFCCSCKGFEEHFPHRIDRYAGAPAWSMGSTFSFRYRFLGVWLPWEGEIIDWVPGARFVDRMCKGTFREFVHTHLFEPLPNGTLYTDAMEFTLGMGEFVDRVLGKPMLDRTVRKRHARLLEIFGTTSSAPGDGYAIDRL